MLTFFIAVHYIIHAEDKVGELISAAEADKLVAAQEMSKIKTSALDVGEEKLVENGIELDIDRVVDFGKVSEAISYNGPSLIELYAKLRFVKNFDVTVSAFNFLLSDFNYLSPNPVANYRISFAGVLSNKSGDIEDLFREFDLFNGEVKKNFENSQIKHAELPRDINFTEKHYSFPIDFTITK